MNKSLYSKLVLVILILLLSLMSVVGAFLTNEIRVFFLNDFYDQMKTVFENQKLVDDLYNASNQTDAPQKMADIIHTHSGQLGIDSRSRNYYILDGNSGNVLMGSDANVTTLEATPNILTAIAGKEGYISDFNTTYTDVAIPIKGKSTSYIVYIKDNKSNVKELSSALFLIILQALLIGFLISVFLSLLLARTIVKPIQNLTHAAERVADGDFTQNPTSDSKDEIGVLTNTFNNMATQLQTTLNDLKKSESMRREFVANVSHELRTPITSIRSYAETLYDDEDMPKDTEKEFLGVIVNESDRMTNLVSDLLTLSRFDAGSYQFHFDTFSPDRSVKDIYTAMALEAKKRNQNLTIEIDDLPRISGDKSRIEQVLINMVSNAIKYTPNGGNIAITAGSSDDEIWISVKDNGIGIPEEDVPKVFDRFYRVDKARSRESGGTGLGLSIANEIVNRHNGKLELSSKPGEGTEIIMRLPVEVPNAKQS